MEDKEQKSCTGSEDARDSQLFWLHLRIECFKAEFAKWTAIATYALDCSSIQMLPQRVTQVRPCGTGGKLPVSKAMPASCRGGSSNPKTCINGYFETA
jgi:hypothetical protein